MCTSERTKLQVLSSDRFAVGVRRCGRSSSPGDVQLFSLLSFFTVFFSLSVIQAHFFCVMIQGARVFMYVRKKLAVCLLRSLGA